MYTIYHIPGIKIGCTAQRPDERVRQQGFKDFEILEVHEDVYVASKREKELQKQYNLPVDLTPFYHSVNLGDFESRSKGGKKTGPIRGKLNAECGQVQSIAHLGGKISANLPHHPNKLKVMCPHCGKIGTKMIMPRWHFDNCKSKK